MGYERTLFIYLPPPPWLVYIWNAAVYSKVKSRPISSYSELVLSRRHLKALNPLMQFPQAQFKENNDLLTSKGYIVQYLFWKRPLRKKLSYLVS